MEIEVHSYVKVEQDDVSQNNSSIAVHLKQHHQTAHVHICAVCFSKYLQ